MYKQLTDFSILYNIILLTEFVIQTNLFCNRLHLELQSKKNKNILYNNKLSKHKLEKSLKRYARLGSARANLIYNSFIYRYHRANYTMFRIFVKH